MPDRIRGWSWILPRGGGLLPLLVLLFVLIRVGEAGGMMPAWVRSYGDDLLCLPLVLSFTVAVHRLSGRPGPGGLPIAHGLVAVVVFAVYFELILPALHAGAVGDPLDVLMYFAGFLVFQFGLNRPVAVRHRHADIHGMKFFPQTQSN